MNCLIIRIIINININFFKTKKYNQIELNLLINK